MLKLQRMSLEDVLKCGSNFEMSPPWATISSRFWVPWAWAENGDTCGSVPATPRAAAPFSNPRRLIFMSCTSRKILPYKNKRGDRVAAPVNVQYEALLRGPPGPPAQPSQPYQPGPQQQEARWPGHVIEGKVQAAQHALSLAI